MTFVERLLSLTIICVMLLCCTPLSVLAQEHETIVVSCAVEGWPPYLVTDDPTAPGSGILFDVLREITQATGRAMRVVYYPEVRSLMYLKSGAVDAFPKAKEWMAEPQDFLWTEPVLASEDVVVTRRGSDLTFHTLDDLLGRDIAIVQGFQYPKLAQHFENRAITRHTAQDTETILRLVQSGRVEAALTNRKVAQWIISRSSYLDADQLVISDASLDSADFRFAFGNSPRWKQFIPEFNAELARMKADGRFQAILDRYE